MKHIFREYDIRGIADKDLTNEVVFTLGATLGEEIITKGENKAFIGQDARVSSPRISSILAQGLKSKGVETQILSMCPTPLLYFMCHNSPETFKTSSGIMITGSHNPSEYNGFKTIIAKETVHGEFIQKIYKEVIKNIEKAPAVLEVQNHELFDYEDLYLKFLKSNIKLSKKLKVVVDAGNGAGCFLGPKAYKAIGCEVIELFCTPDGSFPNHHPDPTIPKNLIDLQKKVLETKADLGIAYDGDADRIGAVSAKGEILYGDQLLLYLAKGLLAEEPGATIISEVKSSQILYDKLKEWGAKPIMWKTGHSLIKAQMKETDALLAGEMSGHMFFAHRFFGFDDAVYSGARLIEYLSNDPGNLDTFLGSLPKTINTPEMRIDCDESIKFNIVNKFSEIAQNKFGDLVNSIDGSRINIHNGWGLVRASNTQPVLVMRFESNSEENLKKIMDDFSVILNEVSPDLKIPDFV